jgi:hypothetical protein
VVPYLLDSPRIRGSSRLDRPGRQNPVAQRAV